MRPEKDDLNYYKPELADYGETEISLEPSFLELEHQDNLTVLIKHDYYSTDSIHGRLLIGKFLKSLCQGQMKIGKLFFIDTSVRLLDKNNEFYTLVADLTSHSASTYVCTESLEAYDVDLSDELKFNRALASDIAAEIIAADRVITIE